MPGLMMFEDNGTVRSATAFDSARRATAVTKSDDTALTGVRGLYVGGAGDVAVIMAEDTEAVTFAGVPAGAFLPLAVKKVMATNTTATGIVALY